jgi:hypothetical protein
MRKQAICSDAVKLDGFPFSIRNSVGLLVCWK